jgi:hypothetical protein
MCAFCDSPSVSHGGEHLWDDWINEELPKKIKYDAVRKASRYPRPLEFGQAGLNEKIPSVCLSCNQTWMSSITGKVKAEFRDAIIDGAPFSLDLKGAALLASFTFMKAVVQDYGYNVNDPFFTRAACERFRQSLTLPPLLKVWFAAYRGREQYAFHGSIYVVEAVEGPFAGMQFFSYTYIVGHLALQLLAPRWKDISHRHRPLFSLIPNRERWQRAAIQFWPYSGETLFWPPELYIGNNVIQQFFNRFQANVRLR